MKRLGIGIAMLLLAGCSRGAGGVLPEANPIAAARSTAKASIHFTIKIPKRDRRHGHYISVSTQSIAVKVYNATHTALLSTTVQNLAPSSPGCVQLYKGTQCTVSAVAPPGQDTFDFTTYDQTGGNGHALSAMLDYPFTVATGQANAISFTLGGLAASFSIVPSNSAQATYDPANGLSIIGSNPQPIAIVPLDAHGDTIVGAGVPTPVIDATPATTTLSAPQPSNPNVWTLTSTYSSTNPTTPNAVTLSVSATPIPGSGGTTIHQTIPLKLYQPWIYVVDVTGRLLFAFDESGHSKALSGFYGINVAYGATYVPSTNWVYVSDQSVSRMKVYDVLGNAVTPSASTPFPNLSSPYQSAFDSNDGLLYVPNYGNNTITAYDAQGNQQSVPSFNLAGSFLNGPIAIAFDPNKNYLYIANYTGNTVAAYNEAGIQETDTISTFKNLSTPTGIAVDPNNNFVYVASYNASVTAYNENGAQQSLSGSFSGTNQPGGVAYDPYDGLLYVANYGGGNVTVYDEHGTQQTLAGGAFPGLTNPWGIFVVP